MSQGQPADALQRATGDGKAAGMAPAPDSNSPALQRAYTRRAARRGARGQKRTFKGGGYSKLIHAHFQSEQYAKLSFRARALLIDLLAQYRGANNGDLTTAWSVMHKCGWRSKYLLADAQTELSERGWILRTRRGMLQRGTHTATLWALTFFGIDDCRGAHGHSKFDSGVKPDTMPLHLWRLPDFDKPAAPPKRTVRKQINCPVVGKGFPGSRGEVLSFPDELTRQPGRKLA